VEAHTIIDSGYAEIAVYKNLSTLEPSYDHFFADLYSRNQSKEETIQFNQFYESGVFVLAFGSSLEWIVQGGTNFWKDIANKYRQMEVAELIEGEQGALHVEETSIATTHFKYQVKCVVPQKGSKKEAHKFR